MSPETTVYTIYNAWPAFTEVEYASKIKNKDKFENRKAQAWQSVSDRFRNTYNAITKGMEYPPDQLISISSTIPELELLKTELATPYR